MPRYLIQPHVHLCVSDGQVVMLDLRRDEYVGLGAAESESLSTKVGGWPISHGEDRSCSSTADAPEVQSLLESMVQRGLLTADGGIGRAAIPPSVQSPAKAMLTEPAPRITFGQVGNFGRAWFSAMVALRIRSIESAVRRVSRRKTRLATTNSDDPERMLKLVSVFTALRPFLFTAKEECLFDSLALIEFLAAYGLYPLWVIGVQAHPFAAHSWVQYDDTVLNDYPEHVLKYVPILAI